MRPTPWWGDMEKLRLGRFWMKVAFAFIRPRLNQGTMAGDNWLVRLGAFNTLGEVLLGELVVSVLPITFQGSVVVLQFDILGTKVFIVLCHLCDTGMKALHFGLEVRIG